MNEQIAFPLWGRFLCWLTKRHKRRVRTACSAADPVTVLRCPRCGDLKPVKAKAA